MFSEATDTRRELIKAAKFREAFKLFKHIFE